MQQQTFDFTAATANPSPPAVAIVREHLAQRGFWTYRGFRLAVDAALERNGIAHIAFSAALGEPKDLVSRCITGRSKSAVFRVAEALG